MLITVTTTSTSIRGLLNTAGDDISKYTNTGYDIIIQNLGTEDIYIEMGASATSTDGVKIAQNENFSFNGALMNNTNLIAGSSNNNVRVLIKE